MDKDKNDELKSSIKISKGRYDPTKIGLEETFSLLKFSTLKG